MCLKVVDKHNELAFIHNFVSNDSQNAEKILCLLVLPLFSSWFLWIMSGFRQSLFATYAAYTEKNWSIAVTK